MTRSGSAATTGSCSRCLSPPAIQGDCIARAPPFIHACNAHGRRLRLPGIASRLGMLERVRLSPEGYSADELIRLTECMFSQGCRVFGLSYHSPTLVPGNTDYVRDDSELERFLDTLKAYLRHFSLQLSGRFLSVRALKDTLQQAA